MKFLSYDSPFGQILLKLCYACYLNLLWFICSIPIVTIGASPGARTGTWAACSSAPLCRTSGSPRCCG